jgi:polysaccharide deacetylase 2 family uncharacterized protein YibQ
MAGDVRKSTARFARYRALRILWIRFGSVVALLLLGFILGRFSGVLVRPVEIALDSGIAPSALAVPTTPEPPNRTTEASPPGPFAMPTTVPHSGGRASVDRAVGPSPAELPDGYQALRLPPLLALPSPAVPPPATTLVAVVIDDVGFVESATEMAIALDPLFTLSFLPYGDHVEKFAAQAREAGHEILLHMPMQPSGAIDPGPNALLSGLSADEIRARLGAAFARVPQAVGLNNHMGSLLTTDAAAMAVVLDEIMARGMMALDSVTTPNTVIGELAVALGVPTESRDVFLDNDRDPALIALQLEELERVARATGSAIALCHPYEETIAALKAWWPAARARGVQLVPISALARPALDHPMVVARVPAEDDINR